MARTCAAAGVMTTMWFTTLMVMVYSLVDCVFTTEAERLGATVIPVSRHTKRQLMIMSDFGSTALCCTPSTFCDCRGG